jgi:hypothetical protein
MRSADASHRGITTILGFQGLMWIANGKTPILISRIQNPIWLNLEIQVVVLQRCRHGKTLDSGISGIQDRLAVNLQNLEIQVVLRCSRGILQETPGSSDLRRRERSGPMARKIEGLAEGDAVPGVLDRQGVADRQSIAGLRARPEHLAVGRDLHRHARSHEHPADGAARRGWFAADESIAARRVG